MSEPMPDDLAAVTVLLQDLVNTARTELAAGATADSIVATIIDATQHATDEATVLLGVAVYLLAREDWTVSGPAEPELYDWYARVVWDDRGRVRIGERSYHGATTASAEQWIEALRRTHSIDALYRRTPVGPWQEQEVPR